MREDPAARRESMYFADRDEAGGVLAQCLTRLRGEDVVVLGLPRGGVPVAFRVAEALDAPLDVLVVRKLGLPSQPELAMGALGEGGVRVVDRDLLRRAGVTPEALRAVERRERDVLDARVSLLRRGRAPVDLSGRVAVVVDDGVATGATARAACEVARHLGASRVVLAVPVAPVDLRREDLGADELVVASTPAPFMAVGAFYRHFEPTTDDEVVALLDRAARRTTRAAAARPDDRERAVEIPAGAVLLPADLCVPAAATGVVVFAHGSGSSRRSPRNRFVAEVLRGAGLGTLLLDLLTPDEALERANVFDIGLLAARLSAATAWLSAQPEHAGRRVGLFGASTGAAAALWAAAEPGSSVAAVVSRGGRPDLAGPRLPLVTAPTLLIVGGRDQAVLELNLEAQRALRCPHRLEVVPGATHLFEEPGTLERAAALAAAWFTHHLPVTGEPPGTEAW